MYIKLKISGIWFINNKAEPQKKLYAGAKIHRNN